MSRGKKMQKKTISMRISNKTYFQLKCLAYEQNKGMSEIVRNLIEDNVPDKLQSELKPKNEQLESGSFSAAAKGDGYGTGKD